MTKKILIVEDDKSTREMLKAALSMEGYSVTAAANRRDGEAALATLRPDLVILDISLPDGSGLDICTRIREDAVLGCTPVIALTGNDTLEDKRKGFCRGMDQYLLKPIEMEELTMWVAALLRRASDRRTPTAAAAETFKDVILDEPAHLVKFKGEDIYDLTRREFSIFASLLRSSPRVLSREEIIAEVWKTASVANLVDTHIHNLKKKLPPKLAARIKSVPGLGFRYSLD